MIILLPSLGCTGLHEYVFNGFKVGPNYSPPAAPVADQWLDATDPAVETSRIDDAAWWRVFHDPVLDSFIATAYRQNLSVRIAGLRILEARALRAIAAGELFPQHQDAFGDYSRVAISKNGPTSMMPVRFFDQWTLGGSLAWELDFWGRFRRAIEAADANLDASIERYDEVLVLLLSDVAQSYMDVRIAEQRLAFAKENVNIQQGSLRIAEDRLRHGVTTRLDVTQAQSDLANTMATIPPLESARRQAVNQLCILLGMPPQDLDAILSASRGIPKAPAQVAVGIPAELLRRRPDVRRVEREVAAQSAMIGVATSELYPHFSINGTIYLDASRFEDLFDANSFAGNVGPSFQWNLLNYGRLANNIRVQESRFQQLAVQYQNTVLQANAEAENALVAFLKSQQQVRSIAESAEAARQSVQLVMSQYQEGIVDFNRVFNVQQFLTQQQDQLAVVEGSVAQNLIQLYRALGGGWQIRLNPAASQSFVLSEEPLQVVPLPKTTPAQQPPLPPPMAGQP
ncbi:MAG: efflux transporter outer membrane subunit [Pirellulales bacterium]|nr:efflux transporter outer membrane subunit [Pirellulales bacterium]